MSTDGRHGSELVMSSTMNRGARALHDEVVEVGVAELRERVVTDMQHPLGEVALARDREVPREVEVVLAIPASPSVAKIPSRCACRGAAPVPFLNAANGACASIGPPFASLRNRSATM